MTAKPRTYGPVQIDNACRLGQRVTVLHNGRRKRLMGLSLIDGNVKGPLFRASLWTKPLSHAEITLETVRIEEAK